MAFYPRKKGMELWEETVFVVYGLCLCCKTEVQPEEKGFQSVKGNKSKKYFLCKGCQKKWKEESSCCGRLCDISRFKKS